MANKKAPGFEDHLEALQQVVDELETGELSLDESLARYKEGVKRLKRCHDLLRKAEDQVKVLLENADGEIVEEPFESEEE